MSGVNRPGPCPGSVLSVSGYLTSPLKPHCLLTDLILNVVSHNVIFISANICELFNDFRTKGRASPGGIKKLFFFTFSQKGGVSANPKNPYQNKLTW